MRTFIFVLAVVILILAIGLKIGNQANQNKQNSQSPVGATVTVENSRFIPTLVSVEKNQSVAFENKDSQGYNLISSQSNAPIVGLLLSNQSKEVIFDQTGSFKYQDSANADIYITINVN